MLSRFLRRVTNSYQTSLFPITGKTFEYFQMFAILIKNNLISKNFLDFKSDGSFLNQIVANTQ